MSRNPIAASLASACLNEAGQFKATALHAIDRAVFDAPGALEDGSPRPRSTRWRSRVRADQRRSRFRAHLFFRQIRGMWACSNPTCDQVPPEHSYTGDVSAACTRRPRLPAVADLGSSKLLYCFQCGDVSLGGFVVERGDEDDPRSWYLSGSPSTFAHESLPVFRRTYSDVFMWYWPGGVLDDRIAGHTAPGSDRATEFFFKPVIYNHRIGLLDAAVVGDEPTGTYLSTKGAPAEGSSRMPALPERCPRCLARGWNTAPRFFRGDVRSPIRAHTTGTSRVGQILLDRVVHELGERGKPSKTIVFTDSRDDAANTAAGVELNHFRDLVRQLTIEAIEATTDEPESLRKAANREQLSDAEQEAVDRIQETQPQLYIAYVLRAAGQAQPEHIERIVAFEKEAAERAGSTTFPDMVRQLETRMVSLGVNPAGPWPVVAEDRRRRAVVACL